MAESLDVLHLVSNSDTFEDNMASDFKIAYNNALDLTGKKIALVDITLTKAQENVLDEVIVVTDLKGEEQVYYGSLHAETSFGSVSSELNSGFTLPDVNFTDYVKSHELMPTYEGTYLDVRDRILQRYAKVAIRDSDGRLLGGALMTPAPGAPPGVGKLRIVNTSDFPMLIEMSLFPDYVHGWVVERIVDGPAHVTGPTLPTSNLFQWNEVFRREAVNSGITSYKIEKNSSAEIVVSIRHWTSELLLAWSSDNIATNVQLFEANLLKLTVRGKLKRAHQAVDKIITPGPGYFDTIQELMEVLESNTHFNHLAKVELRRGKKVRFNLGPQCRVNLGGLRHHFGFDLDKSVLENRTNQPKIFDSQRPPDMSRGTHHFYIYCSIVQDVMINDRRLCLLATVDASEGVYGEQKLHHIIHPLFVKCVPGRQQLIEVTISDDVGNHSRLLMGRTKLTCSIQNA